MKRYLPFVKSDPVVAVVRLSGSIGAGPRVAISDQTMKTAIERAFRKGKPKAVALLINSPGGSPVQSSLIAQRIRRLSKEKDIPVHAFVEDVAASGGYWLACAADHIWADYGSIIGSVGVISAGFGLPEFLDRHGVERRVHTAGKSKSMLDPFRPEKEEDVARLRGILDEMHSGFIDWIKERRGPKLVQETELFTGEVWLGRKAQELGLIDGLAHLEPKMKELYGEKTRFVHHGRRRPLFQRLGATMAQDALAGLEERAAYARFGL